MVTLVRKARYTNKTCILKTYANNEEIGKGYPNIFLNLRIKEKHVFHMILGQRIVDIGVPAEQPSVDKVYRSDLEGMMSYTNSKEWVNYIYSDVNLNHFDFPSECLHKELVDYVHDIVKEFVESGLKSKIVRIDITAEVEVRNVHIYDDDDDDEVQSESSMEEDDQKAGRLGASKASINMLERKKYEKAGEEAAEACMVCRDEFLIDDDIAVMPCVQSHFFHEICIVKWLEESHVCPLCRFELPKAE